MSDNNRNLFYLYELADYKVAEQYSDVRGWDVEDIDNRIIGKVDNLLVDKDKEMVVYLDVEVSKSVIEAGFNIFNEPANEGVHGFVNKDGDNHIIIPIDMATLDKENKKVRTNDLNHESFAVTRRFSKGTAIDRDFESSVIQDYLVYKRNAESSQSNKLVG